MMALLAGQALLVSCDTVHEKPTFEYMPDMADQPSVKAQRQEMRMPVAGTVAQDYVAYPYAQDQGDLAGATLKNPLPLDKATFAKGKKYYNTYCIVCHGTAGKGDGPIVPKFPMPPSLNSEKVRTWSDGRIFHVISTGQNLMPSYASQVLPEERWAIITYLRAIQRSVSPTAEDVEIYNKNSK